MNTYAPLALGLLLLFPVLAQAATFDEQRHAIISQLIVLIQQEITVLEAQLASDGANTPPAPVLGATGTSTDPLPVQISQLTTQLQNMPEFQLFTGSIQDHSWFNVVANQPLTSVTGPKVASFEVVENGDTNYRLTKDPAYTYKVNLQGVEVGTEVQVTFTDTNGATITKSL